MKLEILLALFIRVNLSIEAFTIKSEEFFSTRELDNDDCYEITPQERIRILSTPPKNSESVQDILETLQEEAEYTEEEEEESNIMNLVDNFRSIMLTKPARYAEIFFNGVTHYVDMGRYGTSQRTRNVVSTEDFLSRIKRMIWEMIELIWYYFTEEEPPYSKKNQEQKQDDSPEPDSEQSHPTSNEPPVDNHTTESVPPSGISSNHQSNEPIHALDKANVVETPSSPTPNSGKNLPPKQLDTKQQDQNPKPDGKDLPEHHPKQQDTRHQDQHPNAGKDLPEHHAKQLDTSNQTQQVETVPTIHQNDSLGSSTESIKPKPEKSIETDRQDKSSQKPVLYLTPLANNPLKSTSEPAS